MGVVNNSVIFVCVALVLSLVIPYATMFAMEDNNTYAFPRPVFMDTRRETNTYANLGTEGGQTLNRP